jgi:hypothetical protein
VRTMVSSRSTAGSPCSLRVPNMIFPLLHRRPERAQRRFCRCDTSFVREGEEVLIDYKEGMRQVADDCVRRSKIPFTESKQPLFDRQHRVDQFRAGQRRAADAVIAAEAMPQSKESTIERQRLAAEVFRRRRGRHVECAEQTA